MKTFEELKEDLSREDSVTILDILDISEESLIYHLSDYIHDNQEIIRVKYYGEGDEAVHWEETAHQLF